MILKATVLSVIPLPKNFEKFNIKTKYLMKLPPILNSLPL